MRRREFLGAAAGGIAWSMAAHAQQQAVPLIGFLSSRSPEESKPHLAGFLRGLEAFGYVDGKSARIEYRWANGQYDQLRRLAGELAQLRPAIIAAAGGAPSARAAKSVTTSIPIAFVAGNSVSEGVVASLNQPGGNITGVDLMSGELTGKRLELLAQLLPAGSLVGFLTNTKSVLSSLRTKDFELAAPAMGREALIVGASTDAEIESSFTTLVQKRVAGLIVENDPFFELTARASYSLDGAARTPGDLSHSRISAGWRSDELRSQSGGGLQPDGRPGWPDSQGRKHRGYARDTPNEIRIGHQPWDCKSA